MKEKHNYPVTTLLSKTQYLRLKDYASIRNVSASKILREYIDDNCPPTGTVAAFRAMRNKKFINSVQEALGIVPIEDKLKNMTSEQVYNALELDVEPNDWAQKYWCRVCSDHVDIYTTTGEDKKCKVCDNYVIGG
jgi:hypothetical protein